MTVHVARMVEAKYTRCFGWGNVSERDTLEDVGVNGRIILEWSLKKLDVNTRIGLNWLRMVRIGMSV